MLLVLAVPQISLAQDPLRLVPPPVGLPGTQGETPQTLMIKVISQVILPIVGLIAVFFIIWGGFQYITSGMNEELAESGKKTLRNGVIGLVVIILSYVIVTVITNALIRGV